MSLTRGIKLISRSRRQSAAIAIGGGTATLLLMAAWNNLEPWTIGRAVVPLRPPLYVTFLPLFLVMMFRAVSAAWTPCPPMMRARPPRTLVPYAALVLAGVNLNPLGQGQVPHEGESHRCADADAQHQAPRVSRGMELHHHAETEIIRQTDVTTCSSYFAEAPWVEANHSALASKPKADR